MKRFTLLAFAFIGLAACDAPPTPTEPALKAAPTGAPSFAKVANVKQDISGTLFNSCPPAEAVAFQGSIHIVVTEQAKATSTTLRFHFNTQGISGLGLVTGDRYSIQENFKETDVFSPDGVLVSFEFDDRFRMVRQGSNDNLWLRVTVRFTPPDNFEIIRNELECRG